MRHVFIDDHYFDIDDIVTLIAENNNHCTVYFRGGDHVHLSGVYERLHAAIKRHRLPIGVKDLPDPPIPPKGRILNH